MHLIDSETARRIFRSHPFTKSKSALKNLLTPLFPDRLSPMEIEPGLSLHLDTFKDNKRIFWSYEEIEAPLQFYIDRYLPVNGQVIDCGAHTGIIGFLAARRKNACVTLIEARPATCDLIQVSIDNNPFLSKCCTLIRKPCSLNGDDRYQGVEYCTLAQIIESHGKKVNLLKVDVDGPDFEVLMSAGEYLKPEFVEGIFIEIAPSNAKAIEFIQAQGYEIFGSRRMVMREIKNLHRPLVEWDCFAYMSKPYPHTTRTENLLCLGKDSDLCRYLKSWCLPFENVDWK